MKLNAKNVSEIFMSCLYKEGEKVENPKIVEGIVMSVGFNPERIKKNEVDIYDMLKQLPLGFQKDTGGGMTFLNACNDKDGNHWGEHQTMEQLVVLGLAIDKVTYCMPRDMWTSLPGGMPYLVVE